MPYTDTPRAPGTPEPNATYFESEIARIDALLGAACNHQQVLQATLAEHESARPRTPDEIPSWVTTAAQIQRQIAALATLIHWYRHDLATAKDDLLDWYRHECFSEEGTSDADSEHRAALAA